MPLRWHRKFLEHSPEKLPLGAALCGMQCLDPPLLTQALASPAPQRPTRSAPLAVPGYVVLSFYPHSNPRRLDYDPHHCGSERSKDMLKDAQPRRARPSVCSLPLAQVWLVQKFVPGDVTGSFRENRSLAPCPALGSGRRTCPLSPRPPPKALGL